MNTGKRILSASLAGLALAASLDAQAPQSLQLKSAGTPGRVHYDLETGRITKLVRPRDLQAAGQPKAVSQNSERALLRRFNNTLATGYFTTIAVGSEFVDWASKDTDGAFVTAVKFSYASMSALPSLDLSFYSGTAGGAGVCTLGTELARLSFAGLPGTSPSIPPGFGVTFDVTATLANGVYVPDGRFGWGYSTTTPDTGVALTDFGTNTGWSDALQWWNASPASSGTCLGNVFFGGCSTGSIPPPGTGGTPCASLYLGLVEYTPSLQASCTVRNSGNPTNLTVTGPPQIGGSLQASTVAPIAAVVVAAGALPGTVVTGTVQGVLLCDPSFLFGPVGMTTNGSFSMAVPRRAGLEGLSFCLQAAEVVGPGSFQLTNAYDCTIGG